MKALIKLKTGETIKAEVNSSYSRAGIHYYEITKNALETFIDFIPGESVKITADDVDSLIYTMA